MPATAKLPPLLETPQHLLREFPILGSATDLLVAFSGGLDSTVLLHLLVQARDAGLLAGPLHAIHINHGLMASANAWQSHCESCCSTLKVPLTVHTLHLQEQHAAGKISEAAARDQRYEAFLDTLPAGGLLLQAHHQQDQAETLLFRLLRGTGLKGLAGIPRLRDFGAGQLLRPLLGVSRPALQDYAQQHQLSWVEDPSNAQDHYSRNYLRNSVMPLLYARWPELAERFALTAANCAEAGALLEEVAGEDLRQVLDSGGGLSLPRLQQFSPERRRNLLRHWYPLTVGTHLPALNHQSLDTLERELIAASDDAAPVLIWGEGEARREVRRFRQHLYLIRELPPLPTHYLWDGASPLYLPSPLGSLALVPSDNQEALALVPGIPLEVRFRQGGEQIKLPGRPTRPLKKLLQELGVAPWLRDSIPLLYQQGTLVAVADWFLVERPHELPVGKRLKLEWKHPDLHCGK